MLRGGGHIIIIAAIEDGGDVAVTRVVLI